MADTTRHRIVALALFAPWLAVVCCAAWNHALWRDEVRALSRALDGKNIVDMFQGVRMEGHPVLWYLLLRGAHVLFPRPQVLQAVALLVAAAAVLLLLLRSPFPLPLKAVILASNLFVFEYSVMARNYGISTLLLFLLAVLYRHRRDRGIPLGILLFLLANCNAPSILLVGGFLLFWLVDILAGKCERRSAALRAFRWNSAIAILGVAIAIATMLPSVQSYAMGSDKPVGNIIVQISKSVLLPAAKFEHLMQLARQSLSLIHVQPDLPSLLLLSLILCGSTLGLIRHPGALLAALTTLIGFSLFFTFLYPGDYRHEGLWLSFLICLYWIVASPGGQPEPRMPAGWMRIVRPASTIGWILFVVLISLQAPIGIEHVLASSGDGPPFSRSRDLADLIRSRPDLRNAIVIADPDYLVEPLSYYVSNPTYLLREQRFGNVVLWTQEARLSLSLGDVLASARTLHAESNKPILILLAHQLDPFSPAQILRESYAWEFVTTPEQISAFLGSTQLIESLTPALTDESYDVYLLK